MEKHAYFIQKLTTYKIKSVKETELTYQFEVENCTELNKNSTMYFTKDSFWKNKITKIPQKNDVLVIGDGHFWLIAEAEANNTIIIAESPEIRKDFIKGITKDLK